MFKRIGEFFLPAPNLNIVALFDSSQETTKELTRIVHYLPGIKSIKIKTSVSFFDFFSGPLVLVFRKKNDFTTKVYNRIFPGRVVRLTAEEIPFGAWLFTDLPWKFNHLISIGKDDLEKKSEERFKNLVTKMKSVKPESAVYIFGTGPSLSKIKFDQITGIHSLACNSFIKNKPVVNQLPLDIIVSSDAALYFGPALIAKIFLFDTGRRMIENPGLHFIYPFSFHQVVLASLPVEVYNRLIPIPRKSSKDLLILTSKFELPDIGNTLNTLMLPVSLAISKKVVLFGFDGQPPASEIQPENEAKIWNHSEDFSYDYYHESIRQFEPGFYDFHQNAAKSKKYTQIYQGDELDMNLLKAEEKGYKIEMAHPTFTNSLMKRYSTRYQHLFH